MAKKIRVASGEENVALIIDEGHNADVEFKNAKSKDTAYRREIGELVLPLMENNEISLRVKGLKSTALVTRRQSVKVNVESDRFSVIEEAVDKGGFDGVVSKKVVATISPKKLEKIRQLVGDVVFDDAVSVKTEYKVDPAGFRELDPTGSPEMIDLKKALDDCVEVTTSTTVKYEANKE